LPPKPINRESPPQLPAPSESTQLPEKSKVVDRDDINWILMTELHPKHHEDPNVIGFIKAYLNCRSVNQSAREIGISNRAAQNLKNRRDIHNCIVKITEAAVLKHGYDATEIVERVKEIVNVDPLECQNEDGSFKTRLADITPETRRAIKKMKVRNEYSFDPNGMKVVTGQIIDIEFWDKIRSAELLGREKETFKETKRVEHDMTKNMSSLLLESKKLAEQHVAGMRDVIEVEVKDASTE